MINKFYIFFIARQFYEFVDIQWVNQLWKSLNFVRINGPREVQPFRNQSKEFLYLSTENIVDHWIKFASGISWSLGPAKGPTPCLRQKFLSNAPGLSVEWLTLGIYLCIILYNWFQVFWRLQEINLAQASQYESIDKHGHLMVRFQFCQTWSCLKKLKGWKLGLWWHLELLYCWCTPTLDEIWE